MEKFFALAKNKTNVKTEIIAGITTFMAMAYILMVNPVMFDTLDEVSFGAAYIATAIPFAFPRIVIMIMNLTKKGAASSSQGMTAVPTLS